MSDPVECQACHKPIRSAASLGRRIGGRCWRKLRPDQRALMRRLLRLTKRPSAAAVRRALNQPPPSADGQLPLDEQEQQ
ncbi:hypothetical protein [Streptomyces scabiei]|uniref:hypothetical protein n=1 Tax=Streptomyces scabiei TaxID=1930 RepID=UPI0029A2CA2E|nr:hypothetical protein [Streptomyces scabiei]MDX3202100.1 hypothetical protein [Streptomyces scabiei]MDX3217713.1 hypothetical protein [Streptomyces scabiei]